jgi:hypothetical protein
MVNGKATYRSMIVPERNIIDAAVWDEINAVKADEADEKVRKERISELRKGLTKQQFVINVYAPAETEVESGEVKVLKGSWEAHKLVFKDTLEEVPEEYDGDKPTILIPVNPNGGGTLYAKMITAVQEGASVPNGKKRLIVTDPTQFDLKLAAYGEGQFGKRYDITPAEVYDLDQAVLTIPRYDLAGWVERATFSDAAIQEIINGDDYEEVVERYRIQKYPIHNFPNDDIPF